MANRSFDDKMDAQRVMLVGGGSISIVADTSNLGKEIAQSIKNQPVIIKEQEIREITIPTIVHDVQKIEVPVIIKEYEKIEVPVIVKEIIIREINVPIIIPKVEVMRIEVPVIIEKVVERVVLPNWAKVAMAGKILLIFGYLIKHFAF